MDIGKSYIHILPEDEVTEADGGALSSVSITERNGARVNIVTDGSEEEKRRQSKNLTGAGCSMDGMRT